MYFNKKYFLLTVLFFIIEVLIALYIKDSIIRPYGGDFLVVMLIYFFVKTFVQIDNLSIAVGVLLFAYTIEILQYFDIVGILGLRGNRLAEIVIGTGFSWWDMLAYTLGVMVVYVLDGKKIHRYAKF